MGVGLPLELFHTFFYVQNFGSHVLNGLAYEDLPSIVSMRIVDIQVLPNRPQSSPPLFLDKIRGYQPLLSLRYAVDISVITF